MALPPPADVGATVARALAEDVGSGDLTAALVPVAQRAHAHGGAGDVDVAGLGAGRG